MSRLHNEAVKYVKACLREKNYAIIHRDDLFGETELEKWHEADAYMANFATSDKARDFEESYLEHLRANQEFEVRRKEQIAEAEDAVKRASEALNAVTVERNAALALKKKNDIAAVQQRFIQASEALRQAKINLYQLGKALALEHKALNKVFKPYVFNGSHYLGRPVNYSDLPIRVAAFPQLLDIANDYYQAPAKIRIATIWRVCPIPETLAPPPRKGSQLWHRDQTDGRILKLFMYYSDVDENSGAMEYIPNSLPSGSKWSEKIPLLDNTGYPPQELVQNLVPPEEIVKCVGRKGTLVFADTAGLHRGGYAIKHPRITAQATYLHPNPLHPQNPLIPRGCNDPSLTPEEYYAFS
jgi:hypothetical protein